MSNSDNHLVLSDTASNIQTGTSFYIVDLEQLPTPSPLANLGANLPNLPETDYLEFTRIQRDTVDIGALESNDLLSSIKFVTDDHQWRVFPNPTQAQLYIKVDFPLKPDAQFFLFDSAGRLISQSALREQINLSSFEAGNYWLILKNGQQWYRKPIIVVD